MTPLRVAVAQLPNRIGDLDGNAARIAEAMDWAEDTGADVLVLPELALTGYPLGDLVLQTEFVADAADALGRLAERSDRLTTVCSTIDRVPPQRMWDTRERDVAICAALLSGGEVRGCYHKVLLPVYDVFDEARNFAPGTEPGVVWRIGDVVAGVAICEDLWSPDGPPEAQAAAGAQVLLVPNASPFHRGKAAGRLANTRQVARRNGVPVVYVNFVGGVDELVFDGGSLVTDAEGTVLARGAEFAADRFLVDVPVAEPRRLRRTPRTVHTRPQPAREPVAPLPREPVADEEAVWNALVAAVRDHVDQHGFAGAALGLSGGVDAALTAMVAAEALGPDRVLALATPGPDTPSEELADARTLAVELGLGFEEVAIEPPSDDADVPAAAAAPTDDDAARRAQRRLSRARAALLTDIFEERGYLVLVTGNKSEIAIGEASLFGDLVGGFAPLKDCPKTLIHQLARWRRGRGPTCSDRMLARPATSWRLSSAPLPPFEILDDIVQRAVEHNDSLVDIVARGHDPRVVEDVLRRIDEAELVRRWAPPGVKITARAFIQDRRMPLGSTWRSHRRRDVGVTAPSKDDVGVTAPSKDPE